MKTRTVWPRILHVLLLLLVSVCAALDWRIAIAATQPGIASVDSDLHAGASASQSRVESRLALVIGNGAYRGKVLGNAQNDARAMGAMLRALGFAVIERENATRREMQEAVHEFATRLEAGGTGLFYFSGHGHASPGKIMLAPIDIDSAAGHTFGANGSLASATSSSAPELAYASAFAQMFDLQTLMDRMAAPRPGQVNLVLLDTCLSDPAARLPVRMPPLPPHTLLASATRPGGFAGDGTRHGLFTGELLRALAAPDEGAAQLFQRAGLAVAQATAGQQVPQVLSSLAPSFRLMSAQASAPAVLAALAPEPQEPAVLGNRAILPKDSDEQYELSFWESIKDSNYPGDYEAYLKTYPNGRFAALARARIARLKAAEPKTAEPKPESPPATPGPSPAAPAAKSAPEKPRAEPKAQPSRPAPPVTAEPKPAPRPDPEQARPAQPAPTPAPQAGKAAPARTGAEMRDCPTCPVLVSLPAGSFTMGTTSGDPSEKPPHRVTIGKPVAIGKFEVTVEEWESCVQAGACQKVESSAGAPKRHPMRDVSWLDATAYLQWLSKLSGKNYRLPTEAEWEYAARGGTTSRFWWGEQMRPAMANCKDCGEPWQKDQPADVGSFPPNPFGLHDMNGSVWEWVDDCWHNNYTGAPTDGRAWEQPNCRVRVIRGGSWREGETYMPSTTRFKYDAAVRQGQNGFRVVRAPD